MIISSNIGILETTFINNLSFTVAIFLWRSIFFIPLFFYKKMKISYINSSSFIRLSGLIAFRGLAALITQLTFTLAIINGDPIVIWPILNATVFVSSIASQFILKEQIYKSDWIALCGVFISSCLIKVN